MAVRTLVVWCPDWPVAAAAAVLDLPPQVPTAVLAAGRVFACSQLARAEGVRRGLRRREAQGRCPELIVVEHDPDRDARVFEPVVATVERLAPGVEVICPGTCAVVARGPVGYFGGESVAAERIVDEVATACGVEAQLGIADGIFAARLAARAGAIVAAGRSAEFLAPFDVSVLDRPELVDLLRRLGIRTLGGFARLPAADVVTRFGHDAALLHRRCRGLDERPVLARQPPPELVITAELDPPVARVDTAAFTARSLADQLHERLTGYGLACTRLGIEARTEHGEELARVWRHDGVLTAADVADRVRWQLDGWLAGTSRSGQSPTSADRPARTGVIGGSGGSGLAAGAEDPDGVPAGRPTAGIVRLRLVPVEIVEHAGLQLGLWGDAGAGRDRAHRALTRVQGMLGPNAVVTAVLGGGRGPVEQVRFVPWGDERVPALSDVPPWPGRLTGPAPATVIPQPLPVDVTDRGGTPVGVTGRHQVTAAPGRVVLPGAAPAEVTGWAGPWPVEERWWAPGEARRRARFQVCLADGRALLLSIESGRWWLEAVYD